MPPLPPCRRWRQDRHHCPQAEPNFGAGSDCRRPWWSFENNARSPPAARGLVDGIWNMGAWKDSLRRAERLTAARTAKLAALWIPHLSAVGGNLGKDPSQYCPIGQPGCILSRKVLFERQPCVRSKQAFCCRRSYVQLKQSLTYLLFSNPSSPATPLRFAVLL